MRLVNFETPQGLALGLVVEEQVMCLSSASRQTGLTVPATMEELLANVGAGLAQIKLFKNRKTSLQDCLTPLEKVTLGPAVHAPGKVICVGLNYRRHAVESKMPIPTEPVLFGKFANAVSAPGADVDVDGLEKLDYEAELCIVMGKRGKNLDPGTAMGHVLGYCNANDLSERALQMKSGQWLLGKSLDGFLPLGPWIRLADETFNPDQLRIRGWLNGEIRQDSNTSDMIFSVSDILCYISRYLTLEPGDVILTGTPEGVILGMDDPVWMKAGDQYTVEVEGLGRLTNRLA